MAVGLSEPAQLHSVKGLRLAAIHCGIKAQVDLDDLTLIELDAGSRVAGVFTRSHFCAAPVTLCRQHLAQTANARYLLINSGNANAATGDAGLEAAQECCAAVAAAGNVMPHEVLPFSTGVIAEPLDAKAIQRAIPQLFATLDENAWLSAAKGIMTTDTLPKAVSTQLRINDATINITGIAKGSGMIKPDMATMLAYIATDAAIDTLTLNAMLETAVKRSFNSITVDGDTSTNDSCILIATGASGVSLDLNHTLFVQALNRVFEQLAQAIIRDAEGATKFVEVQVEGAAHVTDARSLAFTIAESPLVKTALFASDPNWGRLIMAIGRAPLAQIDVHRVDLYLGDLRLLHRGLPDPEYRETAARREMAGDEISIRVNLNLGAAEARIWTSDLSYEYVKINAEYRS